MIPQVRSTPGAVVYDPTHEDYSRCSCMNPHIRSTPEPPVRTTLVIFYPTREDHFKCSKSMILPVIPPPDAVVYDPTSKDYSYIIYDTTSDDHSRCSNLLSNLRTTSNAVFHDTACGTTLDAVLLDLTHQACSTYCSLGSHH